MRSGRPPRGPEAAPNTTIEQQQQAQAMLEYHEHEVKELKVQIGFHEKAAGGKLAGAAAGAGGGIVTTGATLFSGGELAGVGLRQAGITHRWGIEIDDDIAGVARTNGFHIVTADVLETDPATMEPVDFLHASPPCTRASVANQGADEAPLDIAMAEKVAEFIDVIRPRYFTLENVYTYRNFKAFGVITAALSRNGYMWDYDNVNAADFGVPQTRRRLFLRAVLGALLPPLPPPVPWVGWYQAIADLVPTLPDSQFAKWQEARLPSLLKTTLVDQLNMSNNNGACTHRGPDEPSISLTVYNGRHPAPRAFILSNAATEYGDGVRNRAWLAHGRVVKLTPRALARLQSVPDSYILPDKAALACKIIGNGVACRVMATIAGQLVGG